jgi:hypothetical protein
MVHDTVTAMNIAKPALPTHHANCMIMDVTIGFMLLALAGKSMAILPMHIMMESKMHPGFKISLGSSLLQEDSHPLYCIRCWENKKSGLLVVFPSLPSILLPNICSMLGYRERFLASTLLSSIDRALHLA